MALVVIGPEKFPEFAKIVARAFRDIRGYVDDAKREISKELKPVEKELREISRYDPEDYVEALIDSSSDEHDGGDHDTPPDTDVPEPYEHEAESDHHADGEPDDTVSDDNGGDPHTGPVEQDTDNQQSDDQSPEPLDG